MFLFAPIRWALKLVTTLVVAIALYIVVSGVQVYLAQGQTTSSPPTSVAIAVYTPAEPSGGLSPNVIARLEEVRTLFLAHVASRITVAGPGAGATLANSVSWLSRHGLAAANVSSLRARTLAAALSASHATLGRGSTVTIVTDAVNAMVARAGASSAGLVPAVAAVPGSSLGFASELGPLFDQASALAAGRIVGIAHVPWSGG